MKKLSLPVYNLKGESVDTIVLDATVFDKPANPDLLHQVVVTITNNSRQPIAKTKDRGEVAGSGKKPWKQKGTGNARAGSVRSPLWRSGGITFGPSNLHNYNKRLPLKMKQAAWRGVLTDKVAQAQLFIVDSFTELDGKTKTWTNAVTQLKKAMGTLDTKAIMVDSTRLESADRSIRNVAKHTYLSVDQLTLTDVMNYPVVVMTKDALVALTARLTSVSKIKAIA